MNPPDQTIKFDDIAAFQDQDLGGFGAWSDPVEVPQAMISQFADLTGDQQWIHVDVEKATQESPFGTTIAHGFLILSLAPLIKSNAAFRIVGHASALNYGLDSVRFVAPVPAGSSIHGRTRVVSAKAEKGGTMLTQGVELQVVGADRPSLCFEWKILYRG